MASSYGNRERTNETGVYGTVSVGTSATELKVGASALENRDFIIIQPKANKIFIGFDPSVTTSNGIEVKKDQTISIAAGDNIPIYAITDTGTVDVRIGELA